MIYIVKRKSKVEDKR